jgi:hypothetical protein
VSRQLRSDLVGQFLIQDKYVGALVNGLPHPVRFMRNDLGFQFRNLIKSAQQASDEYFAVDADGNAQGPPFQSRNPQLEKTQ